MKNEIVDLLRNFYQVYGRPNEGPPDELNISELTISSDSIEDDLVLLRTFLSDNATRRDFERCRDILEQLANTLADSTKLLQELQELNLDSSLLLDHFTNGIFWFSLASKLDSNAMKEPEKLDLPHQIPDPIRRSLQIQGSLVFKLYIGLVYMREGILNDIFSLDSATRLPTLGLCRKLVNCDYIRHIRNALSHGSFSPCVSGIAFRDKDYLCIASPGFLDWLCTWLFTIFFSCMCMLGADSQPTKG